MKHDMEKIREAFHAIHLRCCSDRLPECPVGEHAQAVRDAIDELEALRAEVAELKASEVEAVERTQEMEMRAATTHENARATYASMRKDIDNALDQNAELRAEVAKKDARIAELEAEVEEDRQSAMERSEHD